MLGFLSMRKKTISIALAGTEVPVFLLDGSQVVVKITPGTTASTLCTVLRKAVRRGAARANARCHFRAHGQSHSRRADRPDRGRLLRALRVRGRLVPPARGDGQGGAGAVQVGPRDGARCVGAVAAVPTVPRAPRASPLLAGPNRLYFKRSMYLPDSPTAQEERKGASLSSGGHYLLFIDAVYHYLHSMLRFTPEEVPAVTAALLASTRGPYSASRDTAAALRGIVADATPLYALQGAAGIVSRESFASRSHGLHTAPGALSIDDLTSRVTAAYAAMERCGVLQAQKLFVKLCKVGFLRRVAAVASLSLSHAHTHTCART